MKKMIFVILVFLLLLSQYGCTVSLPTPSPSAESVATPSPLPSQPEAFQTPLPSAANDGETAGGKTQEKAEEAEACETDPFGNEISWLVDRTYFPLYAMIKAEDMYLYGIESDRGMVLYWNGSGTYFDWPGLTPQAVLPEMKYADFDGDGRKELAVLLLTGSGTNYAIMDVHILETEGDHKPKNANQYTEHVLLGDEIHSIMTKKITASLCEDRENFKLSFCGKSYTVPLSTESDCGEFQGVEYGDIVHFRFEGEDIKISIDLGAIYEKFAIPDYFTTIEATVKYNGNSFALEDYSLSIAPD